jgi:hypothetical protein
VQASGGCQTGRKASFRRPRNRIVKSVEVPIIWAQHGKYASKICGHLTRGGCGPPNILPNVGGGVLLEKPRVPSGPKWSIAPVSGCFQYANAFGYHPAFSRDPVVLNDELTILTKLNAVNTDETLT